jgi:hypothetical protein
MQPVGNSFPEQLKVMTEFLAVPMDNSMGLNATGWVDLVTIDTKPGRLNVHATRADVNILFQCGGTTDYNQARTGAQCYADETAYSVYAKSLGFDYVIGSTTNPSTLHTGGEITERNAGNALVLADGSNAFDYAVDFAGDARLDDETDTSIYFDGVHPTALGASYMAELAAVPIRTIMAL